jgi:uncharacterized coiled-coil protein SlyX
MPDSNLLADRVHQLEELLSHQDRRHEQLNGEVVQLRNDLDRMKAGLQRRVDQLESRVDDQSSLPDPDEKPPHY